LVKIKRRWKMTKRKVGLVLAVVVFTAVLLGGSVISPAAEKKVYIVASDISWPPFEWKDEAGNYVGFDLDVMREIANLQGYEIEIVDIAFDSIIPGVVAGKYDIAASGFTITAKREEVIDFSGPYYFYETYPLAVLDLINKNIDAVIQDEPASRASAAKEKKRIEITGIILTGEKFGFLVKDGDPYGLLPKINEGMLKLRASGEWDKLIAKYFGG